MDYIFNILNEYSKGCRILNKEAIYNILKYLYFEYSVADVYDMHIYRFFRKNKIFSNKFNKNTAATFTGDSIVLYINRIRKLLNKSITPFLIACPDLTEYEVYMTYNIQILNVINHEFEHLLQDAFLNTYSSKIEKRLMKLESNYFSLGDLVISIDSIDKLDEVIRNIINERSKTYSDNYHVSFNERMTEINAVERSNDYLSDYFDKTKNIIYLNNLYLLCFEMYSYIDETDNPTKRFFYNIGKEEEFDELDIDSLSQEDKLRYGFNLDEDFYKMNELIINDNNLKLNKRF